jgi:hypothetical protein
MVRHQQNAASGRDILSAEHTEFEEGFQKRSDNDVKEMIMKPHSSMIHKLAFLQSPRSPPLSVLSSILPNIVLNVNVEILDEGYLGLDLLGMQVV